MQLMDKIAAAMIDQTGGTITIVESLPVKGLQERIGLHLDVVRGNLVTLLLNTVLVPVDFQGAGRYSVAFAFLIFRDFFLARHLCKTGGDAAGYPDAVGSLLREMKDSSPSILEENLL
jgi:hypothetical protein